MKKCTGTCCAIVSEIDYNVKALQCRDVSFRRHDGAVSLSKWVIYNVRSIVISTKGEIPEHAN